VLPIERGAGLMQPAMALAARLAADGEWLHLFPEARALCTQLAAHRARISKRTQLCWSRLSLRV